MSLINPRTILTAVKTALEAIRLPVDPFGADVAAFQAVKFFDYEDLTVGLQELLVFKDRVAFIILDDIFHARQSGGRVIKVERKMNLTVLMADRNWAKRETALMGSEPDAATKTPGVILLGHLVIEALFNEVGGVAIVPEDGEIFKLVKQERDNATGRLAWSQQFEMSLGHGAIELSRGAR